MSQLDAILEQFVAQGDDTKDKLLGASFVVSKKDGVIYSGSAGRLHSDADSPRFSSNSFTWVASLTKIITSTCLMQLVERGLIGLDDDARPHVPELAAMQILRGFDADEKPILEDNKTPITLRMLLTHTVGLGYDLADADLMKWSNSVGRKDTNLDWSKAGFNTPLKFTPAEGWYYGSAMDWAAILLEKITGLTIGEYMKANIFDPLGMKDTTFWPSASVADRTVTCTYRQEDGSLLPGALPVPERHEIESGGAGLFSTADDYSTFFQGLLAGKLVSETTLTAMFWPQLYGDQHSSLNAIVYASAASIMAFVPGFPVNLPIDHGFGGLLNLRDVPGKRRRDSMTWSGMANSRWWIDREKGIAAVLIANVLPHGDPVVTKLYNALEKAVYSPLGSVLNSPVHKDAKKK